MANLESVRLRETYLVFPDPLEAGAELLRGQYRPLAANVAAGEVRGRGVLQAGEEFGIVAA